VEPPKPPKSRVTPHRRQFGPRKRLCMAAKRFDSGRRHAIDHRQPLPMGDSTAMQVASPNKAFHPTGLIAAS